MPADRRPASSVRWAQPWPPPGPLPRAPPTGLAAADDAGSPGDTASGLGLKGPAAETPVNPDGGLAVDQSVSAKSSVADFAPGEQGLNSW
jgi:hypothetical protein